MRFSKKIFILVMGILLAALSVIPTYAYELLDRDGDGVTETVRFCDGYEKEALFNYIGILATDLAEGNMQNGIIHYDWLERDDEICRKYPGELRLAEEYLSGWKPYDEENKKLEQSIYSDSLASADSFEKRIDSLQKMIESRCKNIDANAVGFSKAPDFRDTNHYRGYMDQKYHYENAVEKNAFLKGQFPLKEKDYFSAAGKLYRQGIAIIGQPTDILPTGNHLCQVENEWYTISSYWNYHGDSTVTKGITEEAIQELLNIDPREWLMGAPSMCGQTLLLRKLPDDVKQRMSQKWQELGYDFSPYM